MPTTDLVLHLSVTLCTDLLPKNKPVYCMGVGYAEDLVVCVALGVDMFDCVFPTRTAVRLKLYDAPRKPNLLLISNAFSDSVMH